MARKSIGKDKTVLNQAFYIPDGLDEFEYEEEATDEEYIESEDEVDELEPTFSITIVSQKLRKSSNGLDTVVDIVVEVTDVSGADNYELRKSKA